MDKCASGSRLCPHACTIAALICSSDSIVSVARAWNGQEITNFQIKTIGADQHKPLIFFGLRLRSPRCAAQDVVCFL